MFGFFIIPVVNGHRKHCWENTGTDDQGKDDEEYRSREDCSKKGEAHRQSAELTNEQIPKSKGRVEVNIPNTMRYRSSM